MAAGFEMEAAASAMIDQTRESGRQVGVLVHFRNALIPEVVREA